MKHRPILHLNLKSKWFDMILSGEKQEEYRELKPFWHRIFSGGHIKIKGKYYHPTDVVVCFSNGYSKGRRQMLWTLKNLVVREGKKELGAIEGQQYYCLVLDSQIHLI